MKKQLVWLLALMGLMGSMACDKATTVLTPAEEDKLLKDYIAKKGWTAQVTPEGIYYVTDVAGVGSTPSPSNFVKVYYKGYFLDETVFDSNLAPKTPIEFQLTGVVKGWQIGFQKFKPGGKGKLLIPSTYAYGPSGSRSIPGYTPLVFEIELVSFK
jgi:FKBP-type peptidyl-prolyl cis-trans isomerase FkpA